MAGRNFSRDSATLERGLVYLDGVLELSAAAAVGAGTRFEGGTITKTGTGKYRITLDDKYNKLLSWGFTQALTPGAGTIVNVVLDLTAGLPSVAYDAAGTPGWNTIDIVTITGSNVAADTATAMAVAINLVLKNSTTN